MVVLVVLKQFLEAGLGNVDEFDFHLCGSGLCCAAFNDVLLTAAGCLNHLVLGAVAARYELLAEIVGELENHVRFPVAQQLLVIAASRNQHVHGFKVVKVVRVFLQL